MEKEEILGKIKIYVQEVQKLHNIMNREVKILKDNKLIYRLKFSVTIAIIY